MGLRVHFGFPQFRPDVAVVGAKVTEVEKVMVENGRRVGWRSIFEDERAKLPEKTLENVQK